VHFVFASPLSRSKNATSRRTPENGRIVVAS
jgi:hypothetical protein